MIKLSLESFLLDLGLKTLTSLKYFFPSATISLNVPPKNIIETKKPLPFNKFYANNIASMHNSPV